MSRLGQWPFWVIIIVASASIFAFVSRLVILLKTRGFGFAWRWLRSPFGASVVKSEDPAITQQVLELLHERRTACAHGIVFIIWAAMCLYWTKVPMDFLLDPSMHIGNLIEKPGWEVDLFAAFGTIAASVVGLCPFIVNNLRGRQVVYCIFMLDLCAIVLMPVPADDVDQSTAHAILGALTFAGLDLRMQTVTIPTICLMACLIYAHMHTQEQFELWLRAVYVDFVFFSVVLLILYLAQALMEKSIHNEVAVRAGERQQSAVSSLLDMMCDTVLDLDEHARLKDHNAKLAVMLMHGSGRSLQGETLSVLMGDDDSRERLEEALRPPEPTSSGELSVLPKPSMMSVRMRDSMGSRIRVVAYHVPHTTLMGNIHHLIGIREEADFSREPFGEHGGQASEIVSNMPAVQLRPELALRLQQVTVQSGRSRAPHSAGRSIRSSPSSRSSDGDGVDEQIDVARSAEIYLREGLPIRWLAEDLQQELEFEEPQEGDPLQLLGDRMINGSSALLKQIQDMVNSAASSSTEANFIRRLGQWEFKPSPSEGGIGGSTQSDTEASSCKEERKSVWRSLRVSFFVPAKANDGGIPYVAISISTDVGAQRARASPRRLGYSQRGTAASSTPQAFFDARRSIDPSAMLAL